MRIKMEMRKGDWVKIETCFNYLNHLDKLMEETSTEQTLKTLDGFYNIVFAVALYEFALVYNDINKESKELMKKYFENNKDKTKNGGLFDGEIKF